MQMPPRMLFSWELFTCGTHPRFSARNLKCSPLFLLSAAWLAPAWHGNRWDLAPHAQLLWLSQHVLAEPATLESSLKLEPRGAAGSTCRIGHQQCKRQGRCRASWEGCRPCQARKLISLPANEIGLWPSFEGTLPATGVVHETNMTGGLNFPFGAGDRCPTCVIVGQLGQEMVDTSMQALCSCLAGGGGGGHSHGRSRMPVALRLCAHPRRCIHHSGMKRETFKVAQLSFQETRCRRCR